MEERRFVVKAKEIEVGESRFSHPWNPNSEIFGTRLGVLVGLTRPGANWARVPAGKDSYIYHSHYMDEEWIYIISGQAVAEIDGEEYEAAPETSWAFRRRGGPSPAQPSRRRPRLPRRGREPRGGSRGLSAPGQAHAPARPGHRDLRFLRRRGLRATPRRWRAGFRRSGRVGRSEGPRVSPSRRCGAAGSTGRVCRRQRDLRQPWSQG